MMKPFLFFCAGVMIAVSIVAQTVPQKLAKAVTAFEADSQMRHAILGFCVVDSKTGKPVYEHHSQIGLAPASTQKLFTSAAALEILGPKYQYVTQMQFMSPVRRQGMMQARLEITGSGDPTFGSWRYKGTSDTAILNKWVSAIKAMGIQEIKGKIDVYDYHFREETGIPGGYIWEDMGNYYGAGTSLLNWHENQYDLFFNAGTTGEPAKIDKIVPAQKQLAFENEVVAGEPGSGDNAYIYSAPFSTKAYVTGTIPPGRKSFSISGSMPDPAYTFATALRDELIKNGIRIDTTVITSRDHLDVAMATPTYEDIPGGRHQSPTLDSIVYWFLRRSINLYGEALVKTIGKEATYHYSIDSGLVRIKDFWVQHGIDRAALHIEDGSGLSPQNRVTTDAMVKVLQYAKTRPWYNAFYIALPDYNGMKMKSGSIGGARAFAGYHKAKDGKEYTYAIIVNNYDGSSGEAVKKLYKVLDVLK
jgi:D-alanyl-D-alanine carboxypeptidase/D-alanyl-D-alanine-endopeptidase (penicillin-binding protein 4)